jgi:hypothetical protein
MPDEPIVSCGQYLSIDRRALERACRWRYREHALLLLPGKQGESEGGGVSLGIESTHVLFCCCCLEKRGSVKGGGKDCVPYHIKKELRIGSDQIHRVSRLELTWTKTVLSIL